MAKVQQEVAWQTLHDRHAGDLWRFALRLTRDREWAQDVVQEVLLRAWKDPGLADRSDSQTRAWVFTVARRLIIDRWRSATVRRESSVGEVFDQAVPDESGVLLDRWLITDALDGLSAEHRGVIMAAYYEGQSVAQIAVQLKIPEGTVKSRLHYGLRSLKLILQEKGVTRP